MKDSSAEKPTPINTLCSTWAYKTYRKKDESFRLSIDKNREEDRFKPCRTNQQ